MEDYKTRTIEFYENHAGEYIRNTANWQNTEWIVRFSSLLPRKGRVMDLGCGHGRHSKLFSENGFETFGVDLSPRMIERAKSLVRGVKFRVMDMMNLRFKKEEFDGVWCSQSLIHVPRKDVPRTLSEISRVLKPGGAIYLSVREGSQEGMIRKKKYGGAEIFLSHFTEKEIRGFLKMAGFSVLEVNKIYRPHRKTNYLYILARKE